MPSNHDPVVWKYLSGHETRVSTVQHCLDQLFAAGFRGLTARELGKILKPGNVSAVNGTGAALTRLRQDGYIDLDGIKHHVIALAERREDHHVNVLPQFVGDRETWGGYKHKGAGHCATCTCGEDSEA